MQVKIYINENLYKTVTVPGDSYEPGTFWQQIFADKEAGLLDSYGVQSQMSVRYEAVV